jgi:hypothetical protein
MLVKQISVFLENKSGRLAEVTKILGENEIDISALSIADTTDFGILRLIVNDPEKAEKVLSSNGYAVSCANVIAIAVVDEPGGLAAALEVLNFKDIGIEYMYAFVGKHSNEALVILRVDNSELAIKTLLDNNIKVLPSKLVCDL